MVFKGAQFQLKQPVIIRILVIPSSPFLYFKYSLYNTDQLLSDSRQQSGLPIAYHIILTTAYPSQTSVETGFHHFFRFFEQVNLIEKSYNVWFERTLRKEKDRENPKNRCWYILK